jgi:hypothetical protein
MRMPEKGYILASMPDRSHYSVRKGRLTDAEPADTYAHLTPAERIALVWTLTVQAWQFKEPGFRESRLLRHIVRTVRGGR